MNDILCKLKLLEAIAPAYIWGIEILADGSGELIQFLKPESLIDAQSANDPVIAKDGFDDIKQLNIMLTSLINYNGDYDAANDEYYQ